MAFVYLERMFTLRGFVKLAVLNPKKMSHIRRSADAIRFGATVKPTPIESTFNTHWDIPFGCMRTMWCPIRYGFAFEWN